MIIRFFERTGEYVACNGYGDPLPQVPRTCYLEALKEYLRMNGITVDSGIYRVGAKSPARHNESSLAGGSR